MCDNSGQSYVQFISDSFVCLSLYHITQNLYLSIAQTFGFVVRRRHVVTMSMSTLMNGKKAFHKGLLIDIRADAMKT